MTGRPRIAIANLLALAAWFGVLLQFWLSLRLALANGKSAADGIVAYFGYFTVITNLFVALVSSALLLAGRSRAARWLSTPDVVGCATSAIVLVGIAYHFLLRGIWSPQGLQWLADIVLHYLVPLLALALWLVFHDADRLSWKSPLLWSVYPIGYFAYAMLRGEWLATYPYPFIDVSALGYGRALFNAFGLLAAFVVLGFALIAASRLTAFVVARSSARSP